MKKLFCIGLIVLSMVSFVACGDDDKAQPSGGSKPSVENEADDDLVDGDDKDDTDTDDKDDIDDNKDDTKPDAENDDSNDKDDKDDKDDVVVKPNPETKPPVKPETEETQTEDKTERVFKIITQDINYNHVNDGEIKTVGLGVADNIRKILDTISDKYYDGDDLELTTIETVNGKKIAVIDLDDLEAWKPRMQGSLGGSILTYTLKENVLQRDYQGYWIDGVRFTSDGNPIQDNGHVTSITETTYR